MKAEQAANYLMDGLQHLMCGISGCWMFGAWGRFYYDHVETESWYLIVWPLARPESMMTGMTEEENEDSEDEEPVLIRDFANFDITNFMAWAAGAGPIRYYSQLGHHVTHFAYNEREQRFNISMHLHGFDENIAWEINLRCHDDDDGDWPEGMEWADGIGPETTTEEAVILSQDVDELDELGDGSQGAEPGFTPELPRREFRVVQLDEGAPDEGDNTNEGS